MKIASVKLKIETNNIEAMYDNPINPIHKDVIERKIKMFGNQELFLRFRSFSPLLNIITQEEKHCYNCHIG